MDDYVTVAEAPRRGRPLLRALAVLLIGVLLGAIATGYTLTRWDGAARFVRTGAITAPASSAPVAIVRQPVATIPARPVAVAAADQALLAGRVDRIETRIAAIDARAEDAVGNADRAEALLVAFAARRALDRGVALGYLETLLRDRFGGNQPQAVATILNAAHQPVTLDQLQTGLDAVAPALAARSPQDNWLDSVRRELTGLFVVRRAGEPSAAPQDRLARARDQLQNGNVEGALAEVSRMPGHASAAAWITLARRYVSARSALDMIETAALLTPPRQSAGDTVWPTPAPGADTDIEPDTTAPAAPAATDSPVAAQPAPSEIRLSR